MSIENDHPHQCNGCPNCFRQARHAARCCKVSATDLRDGSVYTFSEEDEAEFIAADTARMEASYARAHYECSCGECFNEIAHAKQCRKCRTYAPLGYCTEVLDRDLDHAVVWRSQLTEWNASVEELTALLNGMGEFIERDSPGDLILQNRRMDVEEAELRQQVVELVGYLPGNLKHRLGEVAEVGA